MLDDQVTFDASDGGIKKARLKQALVWLCAAIVSFIVLVFAWSMYPIPDGDSAYFIPTIKSFISDGQLMNQYVDLSYTTDPRGLGRFLFYTLGFPLITGIALSWSGYTSYPSVFTLLAIFRIASILLFTGSVLREAVDSKQDSNVYWLVVGGLVISNGLFLFASNGRPEILSMLIVSAALLSSQLIRKARKRHLVLTLLIGLLFPVSLANGFIACSYYLFYLIINVKRSIARLGYLFLSIGWGILLVSLSYLVASVPILDGIQGLLIHSRIQLNRSGSDFFHVLLYWHAWILFAVLAFIKLLRSTVFPTAVGDKCLPRTDAAWLFCSYGIFGFCIYFFGLRSAPIQYNLYAFLPLYQLYSLGLYRGLYSFDSSLLSKAKSFLFGSAIAISLVNPIRAILLFPYYLISDHTYVKAKDRFQQVASQKCQLYYSRAIVVLDEPQRGREYTPKVIEDWTASPVKNIRQSSDGCFVAILQEVNNNTNHPVGVSIVDNYSDESMLTSFLKGIRIINSPKGYSFKAYRSN